MKKFISVFLIVCMLMLMFASCNLTNGTEYPDVGSTTASDNSGTEHPDAGNTTTNDNSGETSVTDALSTTSAETNETVNFSKGLSFYLNEDNSSYTVSGIGSCKDTELIIPSTYNGFPVTKVGDNAFANCTNIISVTIPSSISSMGEGAFEGCNGLTAVYIFDIAKWCSLNFNYYNANPIYYAQKLYLNNILVTDLVIPDGVTTLGDYSLMCIDHLNSVTIPSSVTRIGKSTFAKCKKLTSVELEGTMAQWNNIDIDSSFVTYLNVPVIECKDGNALPYVSKGLSFTLNSDKSSYSVSGMGSCTDTEVYIPDIYNGLPVTKIGDNAFVNCSEISELSIPASITSIGEDAFAGCNDILVVYITDIAQWCSLNFNYYNANPLYYASNFWLNRAPVKDLVIPDGVTTLGDYSLMCIDSLNSVTIPSSVTRIGKFTFAKCEKLTSVEFEGTMAQWNNIDIDSTFTIYLNVSSIKCSDGYIYLD